MNKEGGEETFRVIKWLPERERGKREGRGWPWVDSGCSWVWLTVSKPAVGVSVTWYGIFLVLYMWRLYQVHHLLSVHTPPLLLSLSPSSLTLIWRETCLNTVFFALLFFCCIWLKRTHGPISLSLSLSQLLGVESGFLLSFCLYPFVLWPIFFAHPHLTLLFSLYLEKREVSNIPLSLSYKYIHVSPLF